MLLYFYPHKLFDHYIPRKKNFDDAKNGRQPGPLLSPRRGDISSKDERECTEVASANSSLMTKLESFSISLRK